MGDWTQNTSTQAEVRVAIFDSLWQTMPMPPFTEDETQARADRIHEYVWQRSTSKGPGAFAA